MSAPKPCEADPSSCVFGKRGAGGWLVAAVSMGCYQICQAKIANALCHFLVMVTL